jgi:hypothetical protein
MANVAIVTLKELGTNCWLPRRFIKGRRCPRVFDCTYPEKKTCRAVDAEIAHMQRRLSETITATGNKIADLLSGKESA